MAKSVISVDMNKAKEMVKDGLRSAREPLLQELDVQFMRAVETGNTKLQSIISTKKQILRDVTDLPAINEANTTTELRNAWPDILKPQD
jgi:predicted metal-dependent hydrolase